MSLRTGSCGCEGENVFAIFIIMTALASIARIALKIVLF